MSEQTRPEQTPVRPEDLEVTLAVRRDLGADNEPAVIAEFLDRVGSAIDDRVDTRIQARTSARTRPGPDRRPSIALAITSMVLAVPITGSVLTFTRGSTGGIILMIITWAAIVAINLAYTRRRDTTS